MGSSCSSGFTMSSDGLNEYKRKQKRALAEAAKENDIEEMNSILISKKT